MPDTLPDGWATVRFGDIVSEYTKHERDPASVGIERVVSLGDLDPLSLRITRWSDAADDSSFTKTFRPGHVLFGKRRVYQKKAALADFAGLCSGDIIVMEARPGRLLPELLPFIVQSDAFFDYAETHSAGGLSPRTKWTSLARFEMPLPPMERQRELVDLFRGFEDAKNRTAKAEIALHLLGVSVLSDLFRGLEQLESLPLERVADVLAGQAKSPARRTGDNPTPYLRVENIKDGVVDLTDLAEMDFTKAEVVRYGIEPGDFLMIGDNANSDYVGMLSVYGSEMPAGVCFQNHVIRVRADPSSNVQPKYLEGLLRWWKMTGEYANMAAGSQIKHLKIRRLAEMPVPLASQAEQEQATSVLSELDRAEAALARHRQRTESLRRHTSTMLLTKSLAPAERLDEVAA